MPKFQVNDHVKTNDLYKRIFPTCTPYHGVITSIDVLEEVDLSNVKGDEFRLPKKTVYMIKVGYYSARNQDYFEKVD